ncbi:unnamed protein product [Rotaria sp. Silwood1]|nr:unnamed protein product [Rotaria sp. Silwood1]
MFEFRITTSRDNQENISTWCISEEIKEYNLDNVEFERDELIDDPCYNNEKMPEGNQFKEDRPTFSQLYDQINKIIKLNYSNNELNIMETNDETYSSLQQD